MATAAIMSEKVGMSQKWVDDKVVRMTVLHVEPMRIVQVKTPEHDGYSTLQVTYGHRDSKKLTKPEAGHFAKASVDAGKRLVELRLEIGRRLRGRPGDRGSTAVAAGTKVDVTTIAGARASPGR